MSSRRLLLGINHWYDQMDNTLHVMLDRSMWFAPIYEVLSKDQFDLIVSHEPRLRGREGEIEEPLRFACGYAQTVFMCTAVETFFIWHYGNAITFLVETGRGALTNLVVLRRWVESRKELKPWKSWLMLDSTTRFRTLTALPFSNFKKAGDYFAEIYGKDCFSHALSKLEYAKLDVVYQDLQNERNSILHRGGEHKCGGSFIGIPRSLCPRKVAGASSSQAVLRVQEFLARRFRQGCLIASLRGTWNRALTRLSLLSFHPAAI